MCPPPSDLLLFGDDALSTDEDIVSFLGGFKVGDPIPVNVITEVDPLSMEPWNLPEGILCLCSSGDPQSCKVRSEIKETRAGYWKSKGEDFRILANDLTVGKKTTREFYSGDVPFGKKTGWMMHEYEAERKPCEGIITTKESSSMCRVFRESDQSPNYEGQHNSEHATCSHDADANSEFVEAMLLSFLKGEESNHSEQDDASQAQVIPGEGQGGLAITDINHRDLLADDFSVGVDATDEFFEEDYIELDDLCSLASSSSSSDNSSNMLVNSEEYFDADALLRDLENGSGLDMGEEHIESRFSVSASSRSNQVMSIGPPTGLLNIGSNNPIVEECTSPPFGNGLISSSTLSLLSPESQCSGEASTSGTSHDNLENQTVDEKVNWSTIKPDSSSVGRKAKLGERYFCFALF